MIHEAVMMRLYKLSNALVKVYCHRRAYIRRVNKNYDSKLRKIPKSRYGSDEYKALLAECELINALSYGGERAEGELRNIKEKYAGLVPDEFYEFRKLCVLIRIIEKYKPVALEDAYEIYNNYCMEAFYTPYEFNRD